MTSDTYDNGKIRVTPKVEMENMKKMLPMNLQFFADDGSGNVGDNQGDRNTNAPQQNSTNSANIDYGKIQQMLNGTLAAKEDVALKAYFKQQGLSQQEVEQAIATFKQQKAANQPDVEALKTELETYKAKALQVQIENKASLAMIELGIDAKNIPYVLKLTDLSAVTDAEGKINDETLKTAINKVLEDVPAFKPSTNSANGFVQIGAQGGNGAEANNDALKKAFGL